MAETILVTGASSGIGKATAQLFQQRNWNVIATMRHPDRAANLEGLDNVLVTRLDVTDEDSIQSAVEHGLDRFGGIDVLVNNAGYGAYGPLEAVSMDQVRREFDTNVIGLLATTKAVLPHMRRAKSGIIVNMSSMGGKLTFPLVSLYCGSKFAVEGISESLQFELEPIGVRIKLIEPDVIRTDFAGRSLVFANDERLAEYQPLVESVRAARARSAAAPTVSDPSVVAEVVWAAATDGTRTLRYPAGQFAADSIAARAREDDADYLVRIKAQFGL